MYAVVVTFTLAPGRRDAFLDLVRDNARRSLAEEPGCHRFDVLSDPDRPDEVFLYELYADGAAFEAHLRSAHFEAFDKAVAGDVRVKAVRSYREVTP